MRNLLLLFVSCFFARFTSAQEPPRFPSDVEQVVVDVVVLTAGGQPVTGLSAAEFELREDGKPQALSSFTVVDVPRTEAAVLPERVSSNREADASRPERLLAVVFDEQHLSATEAEAARKGVAQFIEGLAPGDRLHLVATGSGSAWSAQLPGGKADLLAVLERVRGLRRQDVGPDWISDFEAQRITVHRDKRVGAEVQRRFMENGLIADLMLPPGGIGAANALVRETMGEGHPLVKVRAAEAWGKARDRRRATLAALERTLDGLSSRRGRKTVLLVTAGFIHDTDEPGFARVAEAARRANAVVYFVDARVVSDSGTSRAELGRAIDIRDLGTTLNRNVAEVTGAASVAVDSGGERLGSAATLPDTLGRLADEGRAYYLLGYVPTNRARDGRFRRIDVKLARRGVTVRSRRGYYALPPEAAAGPDAQGPLPPDVRRALDAPFGGGDVPLRMTAYVVGAGEGGRSRVVLVAEADPRAIGLEAREGQVVGAVDTYLVVRPRDGGAAEIQQSGTDLALSQEMRAWLEASWLPLRRARELAAGAYQARMAVRDRASGRTGSVVYNFDVPEAATFRISTPVLTDSVAADGESPALLVRRSFGPGSRLSLQFEVLGATPDPATGLPRVRVGHELRRTSAAPHGEPALLEPGPDGRLSLHLALSPRQPGPAEFVITARDEVSGRTVEVREPFVVDPSVPPPPKSQAPQVAAAPPATAPAGIAIPPVAPGLAGLHQLTALYREGKVAPAVVAFARWEPKDRRSALRALGREPAGDPGTGIAAALLATEAAFAARPGQEKSELQEARRLVEQSRDPRRDQLLRLWLVAAGQRYQYATRFEEAAELFEECLKRDPADPRAHLALGSVHELRATLGLVLRNPLGGTGVPLGSESLATLRAKAGRAKEAGQAEDHYRKALADPATAPEARLRLGRTLRLLGRNPAAARELESAAQAPDPRLRALALLFLSRTLSAEAGSALARARAAHSALPGSQSVAIGFAHALGRAGKRQEAAQVVRATLAAPAPEMDAWLAYQLGALDTSALQALRKEARP